MSKKDPKQQLKTSLKELERVISELNNPKPLSEERKRILQKKVNKHTAYVREYKQKHNGI